MSIQEDQESLLEILARKPDYRSPTPPIGSRAASVAAPEEQAVAEPAPPLFTEADYAVENLAALIEQGSLYALIDGLDQPDLPGLVNSRHRDVDSALYHGVFGEYHQAETPRFVQLDTELMAWLQPIIEQDVAWGWFFTLSPAYARHAPDEVIARLANHYRHLYWAPQSQGTHWLFRLQDPRVLRVWLAHAAPAQVLGFLSPLHQLIRCDGAHCRAITPNPDNPGIRFSLPMPPWSDQLMLAMHGAGTEGVMQRLATHLRGQHPAVADWPDEQLRQFVLQNGSRAYRLGFANERDISKFLSLCVLFGEDFDSGEQGLWASRIIHGDTPIGQSGRMDRLIQAALAQMAEQSGEPTSSSGGES